jgi:hypothetical protein
MNDQWANEPEEMIAPSSRGLALIARIGLYWDIGHWIIA